MCHGTDSDATAPVSSAHCTPWRHAADRKCPPWPSARHVDRTAPTQQVARCTVRRAPVNRPEPKPGAAAVAAALLARREQGAARLFRCIELTVSNSSKSIVPLWSSSKTRIRFHRSCNATQYVPLHRARQVTSCTRLFIQPDAEALEALSEYKKTVRDGPLPSSFWEGHGAPSEVLEQ